MTNFPNLYETLKPPLSAILVSQRLTTVCADCRWPTFDYCV